MKSAFTLIELLVVIAIIAILAAILFPVFAQAKAAAKKSACLSNIKQIATSAHIYMADSDDLYPNSYAQAAGGVWTPGFAGVPFGTWATFGNAADMAAAKANWIDGMMPYTKNVDIFMSPAATRLVTPFPGISVTNTPGATVQASAYSMNGLLSAFSSTAVGSPSQLVAFWTGTGKTAYVGSALLQPYLICPTTAATCTYAPANASCTSRSTLNIHSPNGWDLHGGGANYAFSDGSAKFRRIGSNSTGATDPKTDPRTNYNAGGAGVGWTYVWMESQMCHPYLFRPDYEFNFSDPAVRQ